MVISRYLVKKDDEYCILEEILKPNFKRILKELVVFDLSKFNLDRVIEFRNIITKKIVDMKKYNGCKYVNIRNVVSEEFIESDFVKNNFAKIVSMMLVISKDKSKIVDLNDINSYKILNTEKFLTSDFVKEHYEEIFDTLDEICEKREQANVNIKRKKIKTR